MLGPRPLLTPDLSDFVRQQVYTQGLAGKADASSVAQFVHTGIITVDQLLADYPANESRRGKYARVSDYGGYVDRVLRCDYDSGGLWFWTPTQTEYGRSMAVNANMTLYRLKSPSSVVFTGNIGIGVTRTVTLDPANGRPGEIVEMKAGSIVIAGLLNIAGTGLGSAVSVLMGDYKKFLLDYSGGSLSWVRLV